MPAPLQSGILGPINVSKHAGRKMGITIDMDPSPLLLVAMFNKFGADIRSFKEPLHDAIKEVVAPSMVKNFYAQGRPDRWEPLAEQTVSIKVAQGFAGNARFPLVRTGALRAFAGQLQGWKIDGQEGTATLELSDDLQYGRAHQQGNAEATSALEQTVSRTTGRVIKTERGSPGRVPQRIWAIIQEEDIKPIEKVFDRWLRKRLLASGLATR